MLNCLNNKAIRKTYNRDKIISNKFRLLKSFRIFVFGSELNTKKIKDKSMNNLDQILCFGEVLWDNLPSGAVPGGAPMNVALHLKTVWHSSHWLPAALETISEVANLL
jgi:hypothetical protein